MVSLKLPPTIGRARFDNTKGNPFFYFSKHRPSGPMLSISRNVNMFVCVCVCVFTFEVPFKRLFTPTSRSRISTIFRDSESLEKSNAISGLRFEHFSLEVV